MKHFTSIFLVTILSGCLNAPENKGSADMVKPQQASKPAPQLTIEGQLVYRNIEGGFYILQADNGKRYLPLKLPKALQRDGLRVKVTGSVDMDIRTIQQQGIPLQVTDVVPLSSGGHNPES